MSYIRLLSFHPVLVRLPPPFAFFDSPTYPACVVCQRLAAPFSHILAVPHSRRKTPSTLPDQSPSKSRGLPSGPQDLQNSAAENRIQHFLLANQRFYKYPPRD
jgi:hypothetical protein